MKYTRAPAKGQIDWKALYVDNEHPATARFTPKGVRMLDAKDWRINHPYDGRPIYTNDPLEVDHYRRLNDFVIVPLYAEYEPDIPKKRHSK